METFLSENWQMWVTLAVIGVTVICYSMSRFSLEMTSLFAVGFLMIFFHIFPVESAGGQNLLSSTVLLSGFASPALIAVMALLVVGQGLFHSGALDKPTRVIATLAGSRPQLVVLSTLVLVAVVSAFLNNTPVAVMFIPIMATLAARLRHRPSKLMMSLSFVCILGGMTTLIGSSTNLLAAGIAEQVGVARIGFFDFTVFALILAAVGMVYTLFVVPRLMPNREGLADEMTGGSGKQFIAQIQITYDHPLMGTKSVAGFFPPLKDMTVRMIQRREHAILPPFEDIELQPGDEIILAATRQTLADALRERAGIFANMLEEHHQNQAADAGTGEETPERPTGDLTMVEVVVAPGSRMIGRNIEQIGFRQETGCIVLGIERRSRMIRSQMSDIRLEDGDVLLVLGKASDVEGLRLNRDVIPLEWSATELPDPNRASRARVIFGGTVLAAVSGLVPIEVAALVGAAAMITLDVLNIRQAARAIDRRIFLLVGAALAMGTALDVTGGAAFLGQGVVDVFAGAGPAVALSALFLIIAVITNILTNNATAVLFVPIAVNAANQFGVDPMPFVYMVIFAANCSFATPMGYQTNLLVMGPGHYQFGDYMRAGVPLILILWITFSLFAPWYYAL
ncbi:SLC13 family permease [Tepidicaulis sp. LMO-SS28]|uniref:SLC13 family permease n=1 Tax=Tepidicaulis sp. LMO-SS28 TaxID=3447455 RepID=UPI003EE06038